MRGRRLQPPAGMKTRPTTDKVKESIFNIIQFELEGAVVLDLFAGSGQLGLEALSRGAARAVFTDRDRTAQAAVMKNIEACNAHDRAELYRGDYMAFLASQPPKGYDIIFLDPPYGGEILREALKAIQRFDILKDNGIIICEKAPDDVIEPLPEGLRTVREYRYGQIMLCRLEKS